MATYKHLRSSTANKRPTTSIADGQLAINSNAASAGLFFKDSTGATIIKVGPVHVGTTAPNATPGAGGSSGNSTGEVWLDTSLTPVGVKIWNGSAWVNGTPIGSTTVQGLLELATDVETQTGSDTARAVTPSSLQSKVSDSTSTTSSTTIASSTAVKSAFDLANAALPKSGGTVTGNLEIGTTGSLTFEGSVADGFETTIAVTNPTADRTITLPDQTGNMLVSGNASIVNADVNASAAIAGTKISPDFGSQTVQSTGIFSHALGSAAAPTITFTGDTNTGIYSPGADQLAISTGGSGRLFVDASGNIGLGTSSFPYATGGRTCLDINGSSTSLINLKYGNVVGLTAETSSSAAAITAGGTTIPLVFYTNGSERLRITSAGLVGVGTSSPSQPLQVVGAIASTAQASSLTAASAFIDYNTSFNGTRIGSVGNTTGSAGPIYFSQYSSNASIGRDAAVIDASGRVGIGTTAPGGILHTLTTGSDNVNFFERASGSKFCIYNSGSDSYVGTFSNTPFRLATNDVERARIDTSGRLLVGTSSARGNYFNTSYSTKLQIEDTGSSASASITTNTTNTAEGPSFVFARANGTSVGSTTIVANGNLLGYFAFQGSDGTEFVEAASIKGEVDGTPGANDMPGRLVFSTTADGASSPTERVRITNDGSVLMGKGTQDFGATPGFEFYRGGSDALLFITRLGNPALAINRTNNDGTLVTFSQAGTEEGSISVSGTTVSYNGAHLSRWSQLPGGTERTEILRGSVLSNIDEMCEWGDEENEQLNRMKVSDVEGDKNVSGIFQAWDDDDDTYTNDFYCAMTGDFIIRIGNGVTVERGDLLMSAGDGTAKPQDDDIIRSKTIAKVTSTSVSCTYDDGSYCVPCVLMAC